MTDDDWNRLIAALIPDKDRRAKLRRRLPHDFKLWRCMAEYGMGLTELKRRIKAKIGAEA